MTRIAPILWFVTTMIFRASADEPLTMTCVNLESATREESNAVLAIQGIANRNKPAVFVHQGKLNRWGRFVGQESNNRNELPAEFLKKYRNTDDLFEEYYIAKRGFKKRNPVTLGGFFEEFTPLLKGAVVYDPESTEQQVIAFSFASAEDFLPVTENLLRKYPALSRLPVRERLPGRFHDPLDAQKWAYQTIGKKCSKMAVASYYPEETWLSIDHGISQRAYFYQLNYRPSENIGEYRFLQKILSDMEPGSAVLGWGNGEDAILAAIASHMMYLQCDPAPNLSFHKAVTPVSRTMPDKRMKFDKSAVRLENKHYVTFLINEGDTLKCMGTFYNGGQWFWPQRGRIPINWGTNPAIIEQYPSMMEAIHSTMSDQDLFFSSITGYGYYNPKYSSGRELFTARERETNPLGHITTGSVYSVHNMIDATNGIMDPATDKWLVDRGCDGYVFEASQQAGLQFTSAMQPVVGVDWRLFYPRYRFDKGTDTVRGTIDTILSLAELHPPPFFIPVYAGSPAEFERIAKELPADRFKVVLMDEMMELAKRCGETQLDREVLRMEGELDGKVTLTVRNWNATSRGGTVNAIVPEHWKITPTSWSYGNLEQHTQRSAEFHIEAPQGFTGTRRITFNDNSNGRSIPLDVTRTGSKPPLTKPPLAKKVVASSASPTIDGNCADWDKLTSTPVVHDLARFQLGSMRAQYRFAWDQNNLYFLIEEKTAPGTIVEAYSQKEFGGGDFKQVNGASFWIDFTGAGTSENADFAPRFGFSSSGRNDAYICTINNRVLVSSRPAAKIACSGQPGHRLIEAAVAWSEIELLLDEEHQPHGGIRKHLRKGFGFGLQPLLIENKKNQSFLNGHSPGGGGNTSVLEHKKGRNGPPNGSDAYSLWIELQ